MIETPKDQTLDEALPLHHAIQTQPTSHTDSDSPTVATTATTRVAWWIKPCFIGVVVISLMMIISCLTTMVIIWSGPSWAPANPEQSLIGTCGFDALVLISTLVYVRYCGIHDDQSSPYHHHPSNSGTLLFCQMSTLIPFGFAWTYVIKMQGWSEWDVDPSNPNYQPNPQPFDWGSFFPFATIIVCGIQYIIGLTICFIWFCSCMCSHSNSRNSSFSVSGVYFRPNTYVSEF